MPAVLHRDFPVEIDLATRTDQPGGTPREYPLSFSSEAPVKRYDWMSDSWYYEVLSHDAGDVDLSRAQGGLPLIKRHRMDQIGSVNPVTLDAQSRRLRGVARFSSIAPAQEQETLLREGHLRTVSAGYKILNPMTFAGKAEDGLPIFRCRWQPCEVSTEPIPADISVGFGRGENEQDLVEVTITEGERAMDHTEVYGAAPGTPPATPPAGQARAEQPAPTSTQPPAAPVTGRDRGAEAAEIMEMAQAHGMGARAADWLRRGLTPDQVGREILSGIRTQGPGQPAAESLTPPMSRRDSRRYSVLRALRMQAEGRALDGLEGEVHQELARTQKPENGGVLIPWRMRTDDDLLRERTMGTMQATGGATLVGQQVMPDMIDLLRNRALVLVAGAKLYTGLVGNVLWNKKTAAPTVYWMEENPSSGATQSQPTYGFVSASPKTLIGNVLIPRQLLVQASIDVEADVRNDLATGHGLAIDLAALHGSGTDKQPVGLYSAAGVQLHAVGGVPDIEDITKMPGLIATQNADMGALSWMTTPAMAGVLMRTPVVSGHPLMIWNGNFREGSMFGWSARATNQVSSTLGSGANEHGLIFGNWNDLAVCMWGNAVEIQVDTLTLASKGQVVITSFGMADTAILRPVSFCKGTGALIEAS